MTRTYLDSSVLILAMTASDAVGEGAWKVAFGRGRVFVSSPFVRLEVLPKTKYYGKAAAREFYETWFQTVEEWVAPTMDLVENGFAWPPTLMFLHWTLCTPPVRWKLRWMSSGQVSYPQNPFFGSRV